MVKKVVEKVVEKVVKKVVKKVNGGVLIATKSSCLGNPRGAPCDWLVKWFFVQQYVQQTMGLVLSRVKFCFLTSTSFRIVYRAKRIAKSERSEA